MAKRRTKKSRMVWYRYKVCDRKRLSVELGSFFSTDQFARQCYERMDEGDDAYRILLSQYALVNGRPWLSMFLEKMIFVGTKEQLGKLQAKDHPKRKK